MRLTLTVATSLLAAASMSQVWEKNIAPGFTYRMEYNSAIPRAIHALKWSPGSPSVKAQPELAQGKVYSDDVSKGRETVSSMVARTGAIAGINADFFPYTGNPLGLMVREGELLSVPVKPRAAFGWGKDYAQAGLIQWKLTAEPEGMDPLVLDGINDQCDPNQAVLNGAAAGLALAKNPSMMAVIRVDKTAQPQGVLEGEIQYLQSEQLSAPVGPDTVLLVANGTKAPYVLALRPGQKIRFRSEVAGLDWTKVNSVVGGGPFVVRDNKVAVDWKEQGFVAEFTNGRHPRSAVGRTAENEIMFVVVDGRQSGSIGASLQELGQIMLRLGCVDAINLDGGGSSALNLFGLSLNRPTDGRTEGERKIANGVVFYGTLPTANLELFTLAVPIKVGVGSPIDLQVTRQDGSPVPNAEVIWSSGGAGLVDQGGRLYPHKPGTVNVAAFVGGQLLSATLTVEAPPEPALPPPAKGSKASKSKK